MNTEQRNERHKQCWRSMLADMNVYEADCWLLSEAATNQQEYEELDQAVYLFGVAERWTDQQVEAMNPQAYGQKARSIIDDPEPADTIRTKMFAFAKAIYARALNAIKQAALAACVTRRIRAAKERLVNLVSGLSFDKLKVFDWSAAIAFREQLTNSMRQYAQTDFSLKPLGVCSA